MGGLETKNFWTEMRVGYIYRGCLPPSGFRELRDSVVNSQTVFQAQLNIIDSIRNANLLFLFTPCLELYNIQPLSCIFRPVSHSTHWLA